MPAFVHGKQTKAYLDAYDFSASIKTGAYAATVDTAEVTTWGSSDKVYIPGLVDATQSFEGFYSGGSAEFDQWAAAVLGGTAKQIISLWTESGDTLAAYGFGMRCDSTRYEVRSQTDSASTFTFEAQSSVGVDRLQSLYAKGAVAAAGTVPAADNGASSTFGGAWYVHVFSGTVSACTLLIEHSATQGGAYVPIGTVQFSGTIASPLQGLYAAYGDIAGTVNPLNRWVRVNPTVVTGGAIVMSAGLARR
jgi:hypothetical protein